jgi:DNA-binding beta-propeller fold protein YncE
MYPIGLAVNAQRDLYVANNYNGHSQILVFSPAGVELPARTITKDIGNPAGLAFDAAGNFYESDATNDDWQEYSPAGKFMRKVPTDPNYAPSGIQIEPSTGNIWVALRDNNNITIGEIQVFSPGGKLVCSTTANLVYPLGIVFEPTTGVAWVGNAETPSGNSLSTFNSDCSVHAPPIPVDITPGYLAFDKHADLWASAPLGASVNHFNQSGKDLGGALTQDVSNPYGVAIDSDGFIYEANVSTSTVGKFNAKGQLVKLLM